MKSRQIVLGMLNRHPMTGYDITQLFKTSFAFFFDSSAGMVYPVLRGLEKEDKVTKAVIEQTGKPDKKVFSITQTGRAEFQAYLTSPVEPDIRKSDFLARLMFGDNLTDSQLVKLVEQEIKREKVENQQLQDRLAEYLPSNYELSTGEQFAYEYGLHANQAKIDFCTDWLARHTDK
ncbi:PadR family transcriptional regulator [Furfurilactobacillus curtus]|uniref:PadR family transcriptional regulator n=1 Tax=Furfurilactobacillus curtus TaxID=1746200 RepID=A0ABQ5JLT0_9LACO